MPMIPLPAPGNRKLWMAAIAAVVFGAIVITWLIVQPEGLSLETLIGWASGGLTTLLLPLVGGNVLEHKIHADSRQPAVPPKETP